MTPVNDFFKKIKDIVIVLALVAAVVFYALGISKKNATITGNYKASHDSISATKKGDQTLYSKPVETFTRSQFKELFREEFNVLKKDLGLKGMQSVATVATLSTSEIVAKAKDTVIHGNYSRLPSGHFDSLFHKADSAFNAKIWGYKNKSLQITGLEVDSLRYISWKHYMELQLVESKQPRKGIKKLFFWIPRMKIYTGIPSDTNTVITKISLKKF